QNAIAQGATVQAGTMAYGDILTYDQRPAPRIEIAGVGDMQHGVVLHTGARAYADVVHIAADHGAGPDGAVVPQNHVAYDDGGPVHIHPLAQGGKSAAIGSQG